ncbi:ketopantoate reductase family protein [Lachnoanaerobaculum sp. OBRC5-5]|uniref:ketopantoate reductase family protein n=1 Tax=Lachnoanaerobaculum sp. OBRC5-5 TaxID=936595 RepID=UPI00055377DD|nr:2-dehydropantoate 2-reductase N-terminal domain-containing protein [Lachnoanaerobaculum sp. OBRC5-5]
MRILIYGAGVIGSLYAVIFSNAGYDVSIYARGPRLEKLRSKGLLYLENKNIKKARVKLCSKLSDTDIYDFIFLTVRNDQLKKALTELRTNKSKCIVTMVNNLFEYQELEKIAGMGRILPAFPGAGGSITDDILYASLTPRFIQLTTFGEITGVKTKRSKYLAKIFKKSKIPYKEIRDMYKWQLCHLAMVIPIADAYYEAVCPKKVGLEKNILQKTAKRLKRNFIFLKKDLGEISPWKLNIFIVVPVKILAFALRFLFKSSFSDKFMYRHSMKARSEMIGLHREFYIKLQQPLHPGQRQLT